MANKPLEGHVAVVTGGVRRIGKAIGLALARDGAAIVVNARSSRKEAEAVTARNRLRMPQTLDWQRHQNV